MSWTSAELLTNLTSTSAAGPRFTSSTRYPTAGLHVLRVTLPEVQAATTLPPRDATVRTTVSGLGLVVCVWVGLGEEVVVGWTEGFDVGFDVVLSLGLSVGVGLVGADLSGPGVGAGLAVVNRCETSPAVSTGIEAGVTALPTI